MSSSEVLRVEGLKTYFDTDQGVAKAVDDVSFTLHEGKTLALVGESGCGKSMTAMSILRLIPTPPGRIAGGLIAFDNKNLLDLPERDLQGIRGNDISMIFQEPMTSLNPVFRVGGQIAGALRLHRKLSKADARSEAIGLLEQVGIPAPESRVDDYPHQMSGGMRQRVMIAMALACDPKVLIADEPTTALDVTIQAQILDLLRKLQRERGMAILLITHDLGVVAEMAEDTAIMYAGKIQEQGPTREVFAKRAHPYTQGLFHSLPSLEHEGERLHAISGSVPAAMNFPAGCRFHPRCPYAMDICKEKGYTPDWFETSDHHGVRCWRYDEERMKNLGEAVGIPEVAKS